MFELEDTEVIRVKAADLLMNRVDLEASGTKIQFTGERHEFFKTPVISKYLLELSPHWLHGPNPVRAIANKKPVFSLRIMPWSDDVSGNVSKQYNAHVNMYMTNLNLPHQKLSQEYFVRFCSTSPHASSSEQFYALAESL